MKNKKLIDILKSNGYLFPSTVKEVTDFEKYNNVEGENPIDWDDPTAILKRGLVKIKKAKAFGIEQGDIQNLKMAARKGEKTIPKDILDKMKRKHKNGDK